MHGYRGGEERKKAYPAGGRVPKPSQLFRCRVRQKPGMVVVGPPLPATLPCPAHTARYAILGDNCSAAVIEANHLN